MKAEIIAVGSELLTPSRVDTNSLYLTRRLNERGIEVIRKTIVGDDRNRLAEDLRRARKSSDIVIMTGGLGPTLDDVSLEAATDALGLALVFHAEVIEAMEVRFRRMKRRISENNRRQAYILEGAEILSNANGTAPGQWLEDEAGILMLLPGPPRELEPLFEEQCMPRLARIESAHQFHTVSLRVAGLPESEIDQRIGPIYSAEPRVATTILASPGEIQIHLRGEGGTVEEAREIAESLSEKVEAELGPSVFTRRNESIPEVLLARFRDKGLTLAVAESCTGGMVAEKITAVAGSSDYFLGCAVTYAESAKMEWLGIEESTLKEHGAVSRETAEEMAQGVRRRAGVSVGASTTGVAGPGGTTEKTPAGTVFIGVADDNGVEVQELHIGGERDRVRLWATTRVLDLLRRRVEKL